MVVTLAAAGDVWTCSQPHNRARLVRFPSKEKNCADNERGRRSEARSGEIGVTVSSRTDGCSRDRDKGMDVTDDDTFGEAKVVDLLYTGFEDTDWRERWDASSSQGSWLFLNLSLGEVSAKGGAMVERTDSR
ncbi:unnamed protein product [Sphenostylis stenocarpa]|uniref:Uncharacterized protein n=1 Tax=Sphenostylis stenocarpa TaxID=92480 RepID=A0AA86SXK6_9FABA|nr:unnamed protein product [Sphenostylis stenocarpa]